jgi:uncharacterized membrane protein
VSRLLAPVAAVAAIAWVAIVVASPYLPTALASSMYAIGALICHQRPERSFHLAGAQLPVCARCLGIYAGAAFGLVVATTSGRVYKARRALQTFVGRVLFFGPAQTLIVVTVPTLVTLVVEWVGLWNPGNAVRAIAGAIAGAGVAAVVVTLHYDECTQRRPIASSPQPPPI